MADTEKKWYVLRAISGKEAKVKDSNPRHLVLETSALPTELNP